MRYLSVLSSICLMLMAVGLMTFVRHQWRSESVIHQSIQPSAAPSVNSQPSTNNYRLLASQGWAEEQAAMRTLTGTGTQTTPGLPAQSIVGLRRAQEFYRQAVLRRPLCALCQYHLARVTALLALLSSPHAGNQSERATSIHAGFRRSLTLAPTWATLWEEVGRFFLHFWPALNETDRHFAAACLRHALTLAPERTEAVLASAFPVDPDLPAVVSGPDPRRGLTAARLYQRQGDTERARRQAQKVATRLKEEVTQSDNAFSALAWLGEVQAFLGNQQEAKAAYEQGIALARDPAVRGEFYWHLANWYFERQDYVRAGEYYRRYLALTPDSPEAVLWLGISILRAGNSEEGVRWLERAAGLRPEDVNWQTRLAQAFEEAGRYDRANTLYRRLLARGVQSRSSLLLSLARNYKRLGLRHQALAAYRQLLITDANNAEARSFIALVEGPTHPAR